MRLARSVPPAPAPPPIFLNMSAKPPPVPAPASALSVSFKDASSLEVTLDFAFASPDLRPLLLGSISNPRSKAVTAALKSPSEYWACL